MRASIYARLALAGVMLVLLSACEVEIDVATTVEEDGSGEMAVTVLLGETVRGTLQEKELKSDDPRELAEIRERGEDTFERGPNPVDRLEEDVPPGWSGERVEQGKVEGMLLTARFESLEEVPALLEPLSDFGDELAERVGRETERVGVAAVIRGFSLTRDGPIFRFRAEPNVEEYEGATGGSNNLRANFAISIKLPGGIREHDADEEQDGVLTWHIPPGESRTISATSDLTYDPSSFPVLPVALGGVAAVGALGGWWAVRRRRATGGGEPPFEDVFEDVPVPV